MNILYFITTIIIMIIITLTGFIDHFHMKNIKQKFHNEEVYNAYKKGAFMGMVKILILSSIFYIIILTISLYNNTVYTHIKFKKENIESIINNKIIDQHDSIN